MIHLTEPSVRNVYVAISRPGWYPHTAMVGAVKRKSRKFLWLNSSWALDERNQEEICFQLGHGTEISFCWMKLCFYHVFGYLLDFWSADIIRNIRTCCTLCAELCFETFVCRKSCAVVSIHVSYCLVIELHIKYACAVTDWCSSILYGFVFIFTRYTKRYSKLTLWKTQKITCDTSTLSIDEHDVQRWFRMFHCWWNAVDASRTIRRM